jgi:DNA helicase IV
MNINDNSDELIKEEQRILDGVISQMDRAIDELDESMKRFVDEAKNIDISVNPDQYVQQLMVQMGIKDTKENRERLIQSRDELYHKRLLLELDGVDYEAINVGLHGLYIDGKKVVVDWKMPVCRYYLLNNTSINYTSIVKDKDEEHLTKYKLLLKNDIKLRFTRVKSAKNLIPVEVDKALLDVARTTGFFTADFVNEILGIPESIGAKVDEDVIANLIYDEFLAELLERRSTPEFKNIVFSIQQKQGEIIQSPYNNNLIVQGCAGSGKSMIMLHRIPIILYDDPNSYARNSVFIISPSDMYIQLVDNMRRQLEISDIEMGTIEQFYNLCIDRYSGHSHDEYGTIYRRKRITVEQERYIYSEKCIEDIRACYEELIENYNTPLEKALDFFKISKQECNANELFALRLRERFLLTRNILNKNDEILIKYFNIIYDSIRTIEKFKESVAGIQQKVLSTLRKYVSENEKEIDKWTKELEKYSQDSNSNAVKRRLSNIEISREHIDELNSKISSVEADTDYFSGISSLADKADAMIKPFNTLKEKYSENNIKDIYNAIDNMGMLVGACHMLIWEGSRIENKYMEYIPPIGRELEKLKRLLPGFDSVSGKYLDPEYCIKIAEENRAIALANNTAVRDAYEKILENLGITRNEKGTIRAIVHSPYIFLQALYQFLGKPTVKGNSLIAIDEAQSIAPEELRLLREVNENAVFNMFGDVNQHIENTKGVDSWDEFNEILKYDIREMNENYRNASQITAYCNQKFGLSMIPINTEGRGVHEIDSKDSLVSELTGLVSNNTNNGLMAIIVGNDSEAEFIIDKLSVYQDVLNDMTDKNALDSEKWNIILVNDSKGLEFNTVVVLDNKMSRNQKYIAYTRALDELYVCSAHITKRVNKKTDKAGEDSESEGDTDEKTAVEPETDSESVEPVKVDTSTISDALSEKQTSGNSVNAAIKAEDKRKRKKIIIAIGNAISKKKK